MNKLIIIACIGVICIVGAVVYVGMKPSKVDPSSSQSTTKTQSTTQSPSGGSSTVKPSGSYEEYSPDRLAATKNTKLLFFHAPWCPQCRKLENDIHASGVPEGVTIFKVDYDSSQTLRKQYGVTIQTTLVKIDDQGNLVKKYVAYDEPTLGNVAANLLP